MLIIFSLFVLKDNIKLGNQIKASNSVKIQHVSTVQQNISAQNVCLSSAVKTILLCQRRKGKFWDQVELVNVS